MNTLQKRLKTDKPTDELVNWGFAFEVTDGRTFYSEPIYEVLLDAWAKTKLTGKIVLFAISFRLDRYPCYLVQIIPVTTVKDGALRGPGFEEFTKFRDLIWELASVDQGMRFLKDGSEMGYAMEPFGNSMLRGLIELESGVVRRFQRVDGNEPSLFEQACQRRNPEAIEEPAEDWEE